MLRAIWSRLTRGGDRSVSCVDASAPSASGRTQAPDRPLLVGPLAELYPDPARRHMLHYAFAFDFLPLMAAKEPVRFAGLVRFIESGGNAAEVIRSMWATFDRSVDRNATADSSRRKPDDLHAWHSPTPGWWTLFIEMPPPAMSPAADFISVSVESPENIKGRKGSWPRIAVFTHEHTEGDNGRLVPRSSPRYLGVNLGEGRSNVGLHAADTREHFVDLIRGKLEQLAATWPGRD